MFPFAEVRALRAEAFKFGYEIEGVPGKIVAFSTATSGMRQRYGGDRMIQRNPHYLDFQLWWYPHADSITTGLENEYVGEKMGESFAQFLDRIAVGRALSWRSTHRYIFDGGVDEMLGRILLDVVKVKGWIQVRCQYSQVAYRGLELFVSLHSRICPYPDFLQRTLLNIDGPPAEREVVHPYDWVWLWRPGYRYEFRPYSYDWPRKMEEIRRARSKALRRLKSI